MKKRGTLVIVNQHCSKCGDYCYEWRSQPNTLGGKHAAGNVLLSFAILLAGASISKVLLVFRYMGLSAYSTRTFFAHQRNFLFPVIRSHRETYQAGLIEQLKDMGHLIWSGDGRFDSMGHSAKYGAYTMFCNTVLKVIHFEILQVMLSCMYTYLLCLVIMYWSYCRSISVVSTIRCVSANVCFFFYFIYYDCFRQMRLEEAHLWNWKVQSGPFHFSSLQG